MNNKPISISIRETKQKIIDALNTAGLPIDVLAYIVKEVYDVVTNQATAEYNQALDQFNNPPELPQVAEGEVLE